MAVVVSDIISFINEICDKNINTSSIDDLINSLGDGNAFKTIWMKLTGNELNYSGLETIDEPQRTVEAFLNGAKLQGITPDRLFTYSDLVEKNITPILKCLAFVKKYYELKFQKPSIVYQTPMKQINTPSKSIKRAYGISGATWSAATHRANGGLLELFNSTPMPSNQSNSNVDNNENNNTTQDLQTKIMEVNAIKVELAKKVKQLSEEKEAILGAYQKLLSQTPCKADNSNRNSELAMEESFQSQQSSQQSQRSMQMTVPETPIQLQQLPPPSQQPIQQFNNNLNQIITTTSSIKETMYKQLHSLKQPLEDLKKDISTSTLLTSQDFNTIGQTLMTSLYKIKDELKMKTNKLNEETSMRRNLFNKLQELRGNIRVYCRIRPKLTKDKSNDAVIVKAEDSNTVSVCNTQNTVETNLLYKPKDAKIFEYDQVFGADSSQEDVFKEIQPLIISALDGYRTCIFAYGQTGSGKTYTMEGTYEKPGVNYRALNELFNEKNKRIQETIKFEVSMIEIYNETIHDLLNNYNTLDIRQNTDGEVYLPDVNKIEVNSYDEVNKIMREGNKHRSTGATNANEQSSRSHSLLLIDIFDYNNSTKISYRSQLILIDLAGSERVSKTEASGQRLKEAQNINKSLSSLGDVIQSLYQKQNHIPYRNSKLTYLLKNSLSKDNKILMFININPLLSDQGETLCSLQFASRVRCVELGKAKTNKASEAGSIMDKMEIKKLKNQLETEMVDYKNKIKEYENRNAELERELGICKREINNFSEKENSYKEEIENYKLMINTLKNENFSLKQKRKSSSENDINEMNRNPSICHSDKKMKYNQDYQSYQQQQQSQPQQDYDSTTNLATTLSSSSRSNSRKSIRQSVYPTNTASSSIASTITSNTISNTITNVNPIFMGRKSTILKPTMFNTGFNTRGGAVRVMNNGNANKTNKRIWR